MWNKERSMEILAASFLAMFPLAGISSVLDREGQCPLTDCFNIQCGFESFEYGSNEKTSVINPKVSYEFTAICDAVWINNSIIVVPASVRGSYDHATKKSPRSRISAVRLQAKF